MARLGKQQLLLMEDVYIKRPSKVKLTANWRAIYRELEVGELDPAEKHLCFAAKDFALLRDSVLVLTGLDLRSLNFDMDRLEMSAMTHDEKLANIRPDADHVLIKFLGFEQAPIAVSPLSSVRLPTAEALSLCQLKQVAGILVVENMDTFDYIHQACLPATLINVMVIYRGSGNHSPTAVLHILKQLQDTLSIIAFTDLDPAGLQIAHTLPGVSHWLVPQLVLTSPEQLLSIEQINSTSDFDKQVRQAKYIQTASLNNWHEIADVMLKGRMSIKQQHLLSHHLNLVPLQYVVALG
ncbi:hypothetical protein L9G16_04700 [Shewanella sp. A25]|nr:hypothetical protein [Shewanella shenzhenensis]